jgi:hypothetical protein
VSASGADHAARVVATAATPPPQTDIATPSLINTITWTDRDRFVNNPG